MTLGAILLAGGRGSRVGGATKPLFELGGRTLLARAVAAARDAGAHDIVVVGPELGPALPVRWAREDPPFTGPAAAIVAALEGTAARSEWTLVLACDLARPDAAVARLTADLALLPADTDGLCLADAGSRPQWLTGAYRTPALRRAASALPDAGRHAPVRALMDDLAIAVVEVRDDVAADIDTWQDLRRAREQEES